MARFATTVNLGNDVRLAPPASPPPTTPCTTQKVTHSKELGEELFDNGKGKIVVALPTDTESEENLGTKILQPNKVTDYHDAGSITYNAKPEEYLSLAPGPAEGLHLPPRLAHVPHTDRGSAEGSLLPLVSAQGSVIDAQVDGLLPPLLDNCIAVKGKHKEMLRRENKCRRRRAQQHQPHTSMWTDFTGEFFVPSELPHVVEHRNQMCPSGLASLHPAGDMLFEWSQFGCPTMTGDPWTKDDMAAAVARGPHISARSEAAFAHFADEIKEKVAAGQAKTILWDSIKDNPPKELKISPVAAVPHKSKPF